MIRQDVTLEILNTKYNSNMCAFIGIEYTEIGEDYLCAKMPVNERTRQPLGLLHGGASVVLAESVGSLASNLCVDNTKQYCVGLSINANHIKSLTEGFVYAKAESVHIGGKTHIWNIKVTTEDEELVCMSRLTVAVLDKK